jgi:superfamily I DNA and RNA helicase
MKKRLEESVENILVGTEKAVNKVIIDEVASLIKSIGAADAVNQKNVGQVERMRNEMITELRDLHMLDMEGRSIGKIFSNEEINNMVEELNKKINFFNNKHTSLNTLTKEGQQILTYGHIEARKDKNQQGEMEEAPPLVENGAA